jgi:hypothetical protein
MTALRITPVRLLIAIVFCSLGHQADGADATLRWSLKRGEKLRYNLTQVANRTIDAAGQKITVKNELSVDLTWVVKSVASNGTIELTQTVDRAVSKNVTNGQTLVYDTKDKAGAEVLEIQPLAKLYDALIGHPYTLRISPQGEVIDVKVPDGLAKALAGSPFAATADSGTFFTPEGVKTVLAQLLPALPRTPVKPGSTWSQELHPRADSLKMVVNTAYRVADLASLARIDAKIDTTISAVPGSGVTIKLNKQGGTARFLFDTETGRLAESTREEAYELVADDPNGEVTHSMRLTGSFRLVK